MRHHYTITEITNALRQVGLKRGDTVFSHSNIGFFGLPKGKTTLEHAFRIILEAFFQVIGDNGTLVVPTFTYSFPKGNTFDPDNTPSDCGIFTELFRMHPEAFRSEDPCVSVAALGHKAQMLTQDMPKDAYCEDGFFARFFRENGVICNMNFDAGSTFIHYVEKVLDVPYRYSKTFTGTFIKKGIYETRDATIYVRYLIEGTQAKFEAFDKIAREKGLFVQASVGRGSVGLIKLKDTFDLIRDTLPKRPWFLTKAEAEGLIPNLQNIGEQNK